MDCIIILGPSGEFHPLTTDDFPKFALPFMNIPLINLSINYLTPFASRFFIVCLEKFVKKIDEILVCNVPVEMITTTSYEGMGYILNLLRHKLKTTYFIMCKGDIYGLEPLNALIESFMKSEDDMYVSIIKTTKESPVLCIDSLNYLKMYNSEEIPILKNQKYFVTTEYAIKDFYIIKLSSFGMLESSLYCFKNNILPFLLQKRIKIRVGENMIVQIKSLTEYQSQLELKNHLLGSSESYAYNLIDPECELSSNIDIEDSIIGANVVIEGGSSIKNSIIMDNTIVKMDCQLDSCIIGRDCIIYNKSKLKDCKVASFKDFKSTVKANSIVFTNE